MILFQQWNVELFATNLFDEEAVGGCNRHFEVVVTDVEVEETVFCAGKIEELAAVAAPFHAAAEGGDVSKRDHAVGFSVHQQQGYCKFLCMV